MTHYIFIGGPENLQYWENKRLQGHQWFWSANKHVRPGDVGFIYLSAPLSRIVGEVDIVGEPFFHVGQTIFDNPHMSDKWCVEVANPRYYGNPKEICAKCGNAKHGLFTFYRDGRSCDKYEPTPAPLSIKNLRKLFAQDWGWVRYPRGNTRVPDEILPALKELIGEK